MVTVHIGAGDIARVTVTNASSNTTLVINKPTNVVDGDLMLLKITQNDTLNPSSIALSDPTYWGTAINENFGVNGAVACHTAYYAKEWHTGDATSWTATIGASTLDDESCVVRVSGHDPVTPIDVAAVSQNSTQSTGPVSPSVTTLTDNAVVIYGVSAKNGSVLTGEDAGNPSGTTLIQNKRSRSASGGVNSGLAYELRATAGATGTRTWTAYTSTSQYHSAYTFAIRPGATEAIDSVNGGAGITAGSSGNAAVLSGFGEAPSSGTFGGVALTSFTADTTSAAFSMPGYVDGGVYPNPSASSHTLAIGAASASIALNLPAGHSAVIIASAVDDDATYLGYHITLTDGFKFIFPKELIDPEGDDTAENWDFRVAADGKVTATGGTRVCWRWNNSTGVMTQVTVTINNAGQIVDVKLSGKKITAKKLTAAKLTGGKFR